MVNGSRNTVIYIYSLLELFNSIIPKPYSAKTHKGILQKEEKPRLRVTKHRGPNSSLVVGVHCSDLNLKNLFSLALYRM